GMAVLTRDMPMCRCLGNPSAKQSLTAAYGCWLVDCLIRPVKRRRPEVGPRYSALACRDSDARGGNPGSAKCADCDLGTHEFHAARFPVSGFTKVTFQSTHEKSGAGSCGWASTSLRSTVEALLP